jgi:trigger factor
MAGQQAEFTVKVNELKEKKLPEFNEEFAKEAGYESIKDLRQKAHDYLLKEKTDESDRKIRGALIEQLIQKNPFDVPQALVESQTRALAQDWAQELKRQGVDETTMQSAILSELDNMRKRAESQVRASLMDQELATMAASMQMELDKLKDFYAKNSDRTEDLSFRIRQERTVKFLLDKAKIKSKS